MSPGQELELFLVFITQPQLLLSSTVPATDPIPPRLLLHYLYIIFSFVHDPTVATLTVFFSLFTFPIIEVVNIV